MAMRCMKNYYPNRKSAVYRIFEDGRLELTNNRAEHAVKEIVMGRKDCLFSVSEKGAKINAVYQTLIKTAELNHLNPWKYLGVVAYRNKGTKSPIQEEYARLLS